MSQIRNPFASISNKLTLDVLVKFLEEMYDHYTHRVNTRREYCDCLICKDVRVRKVQVVGIKKESDERVSGFYYYKESDNVIIPASYHDIINLFLNHKTK